MIAAVGSVFSTLPLSSLLQPLELLLVSRIESLQTLSEQQVICHFVIFKI